MTSLIVATRNKHKVSEIKAFLEGQSQQTPINLKSLLDFPDLPEIDENCLSFVGNALKKAKTISQVTGLPVLADDSGLCVKALNDRPGVFSARFAGPKATDTQNNQKLLEEIKTIPASKREAKFVCAIVLYLPNNSFYTSTGELHGSIIDLPRGTHGFGYDPIFLITERNATLAEVPETEKIQFSHRTLALKNLLKITNHFNQLASR